MGQCMSCGAWVPDGQHTCSMCYGDPYHGNDGHYLRWLEERDREEQEQEQEEQEQERSE